MRCRQLPRLGAAGTGRPPTRPPYSPCARQHQPPPPGHQRRANTPEPATSILGRPDNPPAWLAVLLPPGPKPQILPDRPYLFAFLPTSAGNRSPSTEVWGALSQGGEGGAAGGQPGAGGTSLQSLPGGPQLRGQRVPDPPLGAGGTSQSATTGSSTGYPRPPTEGRVCRPVPWPRVGSTHPKSRPRAGRG